MADICGYADRVCHGRENAPQYFFFVYNTFFSNLHITLPFDDFTMGVLRILNVALTQLHPNSWAALRRFEFFVIFLSSFLHPVIFILL